MDQVVELDLKQLFRACLKKWWLIVISAAVAGAVVYICTVFFVTPKYVASASFYVNNSQQSGESQKITSADLATAQRLVMTYVNIIKSDTVLEKVIEKGGLNLTPDQIRAAMTAESMDETEMFRVQVMNADPYLAAHIVNVIADVAPAEISSIMVGSATKVVDRAKVPTAPSSPNNTTNAIIGALVGIVLSVAFVVAQTLLDVRIKSEDDLATISDIPVLGVIPDFFDEGHSGYTAYGASKKKGKR